MSSINRRKQECPECGDNIIDGVCQSCFYEEDDYVADYTEDIDWWEDDYGFDPWGEDE